MWQFYFSKLPIILDILKILSNSKIIAILIISLGIVITFKPELIKKYIMINAIQKQIIANKFYENINAVLDRKILSIYSKIKDTPNAICIAEYIMIRQDPDFIPHVKNYQGRVLKVREFDTQSQQVVDRLQERLIAKERWIPYGTGFSKLMEEDYMMFPFGSVKDVEEIIKNKEDKQSKIMEATFRGPTGTGNFNFPVSKIFLSWIKSTEKDSIVAHPIFLCNKEAGEALDDSFMQDIITETHKEFVEMLNNIDETNSHSIK